MKRAPKQKNEPRQGKTPRQAANPESSIRETPVWSFVLYDHEKPWAFSEADFFGKIMPHLKSRETQSWQEILTQAGGKSAGHGSNNRTIPISKLSPAAQAELRTRRLDDRDALLSLRLTSIERIWGFREGRVLRILWFDPNHEICPANR